MSQQGLTIVSLQTGEADVGDIQTLQHYEFLGILRSVTGQISAVGDKVTATAAVGKDMYLIEAQVNGITGTGSNVYDLIQNLTIVEELISDINGILQTTFLVKGFKVTTGQAIEIEQTVETGGSNARATLLVIEVDTGIDPSTL